MYRRKSASLTHNDVSTRLLNIDGLAQDCGLALYPDSKVHGANMGPTWVLSAPDGPHVGPINLTIRVGVDI